MKKKNIKKSSLILIVIVLLGCIKDQAAKREIVAEIQDDTIDWNLVWRSYHVNPKWGKGITQAQAFENQLNYLIDQKLFAQAAVNDKLDTMKALADYIEFIKEKEMIKELYREEVASKVKISDREYETAYKYIKKKVKFEYISTPDSANALIYIDELKTKAVTEINLIDMATDNSGVSPFYSFGDMAEEMEKVVLNMQLNQIAGPIKIENNFFVIKLIDGISEKFMSETELAEMQSKIKKVIFDRKAKKYSDQYIKDVLEGKSVTVKSKPFKTLSAIFNETIQNKISDKPIMANLSDKEIKTARTNLKDIKDEVLVTFDNGQMTVGEFLNRLMNMPRGLRPKVKMENQLKRAIIVTVRNIYLAKNAYVKGLDRSEKVRYESQWQIDEMLAKHWLLKLKESLKVSQKEKDLLANNEAFLNFVNKKNKKVNDKILDDLSLDFKFLEAKINAIDSLRKISSVEVDSVLFLSKIKQPDKVISEDPIGFSYLEKYN